MKMENPTNKPYGKELILDLHQCNSKTFTRQSIQGYFKQLCEIIDMQRCELTWWDDVGVPEDEKQTEPHLKGTSAVQFITTSNMVVHTLDILENVYINVFSCKDFDENVVKDFSEKWFGGTTVNFQTVQRM